MEIIVLITEMIVYVKNNAVYLFYEIYKDYMNMS